MNERLLFSPYYLSRSCRSIAACVLIAFTLGSVGAVYGADSYESYDVYLLAMYTTNGEFPSAHDRAAAIASRDDQRELADALRVFQSAHADLRPHELESLVRMLIERAERSIRESATIADELAASLSPFLDDISTQPSGLRETLLRTGVLFRDDLQWRRSLQAEGHRIEREIRDRSGNLSAAEAGGVVAWLYAARTLSDPVLLRITVIIEQQVRNRSVVLAARRARTEIERSIDASTTAD